MDLRATYFVEDHPHIGHLVIYVEGGSEPTKAFMHQNFQDLERKLGRTSISHNAIVNRRIHGRLGTEPKQRPSVVSIPMPDKQTRAACIQFIESSGGQFLDWVYPERRLSL